MVTASQTLVDIKKNISNQTMKDHTARLRYFWGALSRDIIHYVNPALEDSTCDVAFLNTSRCKGSPKLSKLYRSNQLTKYLTKYRAHDL